MRPQYVSLLRVVDRQWERCNVDCARQLLEVSHSSITGEIVIAAAILGIWAHSTIKSTSPGPVRVLGLHPDSTKSLDKSQSTGGLVRWGRRVG